MFFWARYLHSLEEKHNKQNIILEQNSSILVSFFSPSLLCVALPTHLRVLLGHLQLRFFRL